MSSGSEVLQVVEGSVALPCLQARRGPMPALYAVPPWASWRPQRCLEVQGAGGDAEIRRLCSDLPQEGDKDPCFPAQARTMAVFLSCTKTVFKMRHEVERWGVPFLLYIWAPRGILGSSVPGHPKTPWVHACITSPSSLSHS